MLVIIFCNSLPTHGYVGELFSFNYGNTKYKVVRRFDVGTAFYIL